MSMDRSLKSHGGLKRHRNVLTRAERIQHLKDMGKWTDDSSPLSLPKIVHRKPVVGKKSKAPQAGETTEEAKK